jgi:GT2 family glycosyltransferase
VNSLSGKKVLCFIALPHHNRFLVPIMEALQEKSMEVGYFTTAAEGAFEITLNQANLPYRHVLDYATADTQQRVTEAFRELRPVYQDKILRHTTLQAVPVVIFDKVVRNAVESYHSIDRMLQVEKPDLLFALHELNPWGKMLGYLSHVHRIPYFTLQEGLYYGDMHYYRFHTDYTTACISWGEACREILMRAGCSGDKIYPLGNTHIWEAKQTFTNSASRLVTRKQLGVGAEKKIVLFMMSHSHYQTFDAAPYLRWAKMRGDVITVFKWHPVTGKEVVDRAMQNLRAELSVLSVYDVDTYALIGASDVCITVGNSTTGLEALVFDKPLIEVRLPDQQYSYSELGVAELAYGFEDIGEKIECILGYGVSQERAQHVKSYLAREFAFHDTGALGRIVNLVEKSLDANCSPEPSPIPAVGHTRFPCTIVLPVNDLPPGDFLATLESISAHTDANLFEVVIVNCAATKEIGELLNSLGGDITIMEGQPDWNYATACNAAAAVAQGKYLAFLKPGVMVSSNWLDGLIRVAEEDADVGLVGGLVLNSNGLIWHLGYAFDVNQSPFSIYQMLPPQGHWAQKKREFNAVQTPFLVSRERFCSLGGFDPELRNRFEDVDFCLRVRTAGARIVYTPECRTVRQVGSWEPSADWKADNCIRFYSKWPGHLWQDDEHYLKEDGLTHDMLSALYRELAGRVAFGAQELARDSLRSDV